jgi:hypothetical protein
VQFMVRQTAEAATQDLTVSVHRQSDDAQVGSSAVLTSAELDTPRTDGRRLIVVLDPTDANVVNGTQYYVRFRTTAAAGAGWQVLLERCVDNGESASMGGTADSAQRIVSGFTEDRSGDLAVNFSVRPPTPTGFDVTVAEL